MVKNVKGKVMADLGRYSRADKTHTHLGSDEIFLSTNMNVFLAGGISEVIMLVSHNMCVRHASSGLMNYE